MITADSQRAQPSLSARPRGGVELRSMLLVDDDETFRERLARALRGRGFDVRTASSVDEGVRLAEVDSPEYAVIDLRMPGTDTAGLRDAALALRRGGVGYYAKSDFVHLDVGRVRRW